MSVNSVRFLLETACEARPEKIALKDGARSYTYAELLERVNRVARYLNELDLPKGGRIGIYSTKSCEQVTAILAVLSTEYVLVPITRLLKPEQVEHIINDCGIRCIITDRVKIKDVKAVHFGGRIISYEASDESDVSFEEIYKCTPTAIECCIKGFDNAAITYSFGSTGLPKGIVITHRSLVDGARIVSRYLQLRETDVISGVLSFNLDYGLNQIFCALYKKATLALHKVVLSRDFFDHLIDDAVTVLPVMPIQLTQLFDEEPERLPDPEHLASVRAITSSGGRITDRMIKNVQGRFKQAQFYSMHGLSEALRSAYLDPVQINIRPDSIGKAVPDVELYIINERGEACKPREMGELIHRGAGIYKGYWNSPEETAQRFKSIRILQKVVNLEGELTDEIVVASGDYVYSDEEGYLYFVCRKDDMIKTRGYRVNPVEIESVVYDNLQEVIDCAVFSVDNEEIEEEIVLVYGAEREIPKNELIFELKKHLPTYMIPGIIVYKKEMPLKSLHHRGIDKAALKAEILKSL